MTTTPALNDDLHTHLCGCPDFGDYTGQVTLVAPDFLKDKWPNGIGIDVCLALEIQGLWKRGIRTTGHCCGHGRIEPTIIVAQECIPAMKSLGYSASSVLPDREDVFLAKTSFRTQSKEIETLRAAMEQARKPDMFWSYDDPEQAWDGFEEAIREAGYGNEVVRLMTGKTLGDAWAANRVLTVDDEGDPDETEEVLFDNEADALRCWPESLQAARTALKGA